MLRWMFIPSFDRNVTIIKIVYKYSQIGRLWCTVNVPVLSNARGGFRGGTTGMHPAYFLAPDCVWVPRRHRVSSLKSVCGPPPHPLKIPASTRMQEFFSIWDLEYTVFPEFWYHLYGILAANSHVYYEGLFQCGTKPLPHQKLKKKEKTKQNKN